MALRLRAWKALPLWLVIVAGLVGLGVVLASELLQRGRSTTLPSQASQDSDLVLTGFRLVTTRGGVTEWELTASRARVFEGRHQALLDDVEGTTRSSNGLVVRFQGASGTFDTLTQDFQIEGPQRGTVVELSNGYVIRADQLSWSQETKEMSSDHAVSITGPRIALTGMGLRVKPATQELRLLRDVRADVF